MKLISHSDPNWLLKFRRINGALTYSQDLIKYQIPLWEKVLTQDDIISTCPKFSDIEESGRFRIAIQYLHSFPYIRPTERVKKVLWDKPFKADKIIFITAYKAFEKMLKNEGLNAVYIPMSIDVDKILKYKTKNIIDDRILYFGNVLHSKLALYNKLKVVCKSNGFELDTISTGKFNKSKNLSQEDVWSLASEYKYGIAVGRCAMELHALGVKTIIAGQKFGGLITNYAEYKQQLRTNMNGRYWTYSSDPLTCLENIEESQIFHSDIKKLNHVEIVAEEYKL